MPAGPRPVTDASTPFTDRFGHRFADVALLELALTHRSWASEVGDGSSNERLEFLGDAVLGLAVAARAYERYPDLSEGEFSKLRAQVVNEACLAEIARERELGSLLRLGKGEETSGGRDKPSLLSDALEAVIGAVFLDGGWVDARAVVDRLVGARLEAAVEAGPGGEDHKTRLQEWTARRLGEVPVYEVEEEGPDHAKRFTATVRVRGELWGSGEGRSKKQAEQSAAGAAWARIDELGEESGTGPTVTREASDAGVA